MNSFVLSLFMNAPLLQTEGTPNNPLGSLGTFLPVIAIVAIFYFLIIRPQNKRQKETQKMLAALKKGDKVVTAGGIHGTIQNVREQTIVVKVDENTKIEFNRSSITNVTVVKEEKSDSEEKEAESEAEDEKK
ncbi:MAG: preprotein translocase subunit YajC [Treponema sp.]|nr:preprotein translocase subunit YajC [Treponema sp.]